MNGNHLISNKGKLIKGPILIEPKIFNDKRGFFYESWNEKEFNDLLNTKVLFKQDNHSKSKKGVLRGLHFQQKPFSQSKLIRCTRGRIFDVLVDIRIDSQTFGSWASIELNDENKYQLWIPQGFAHGFLTISEIAEVQYKTNNYYNKESEVSLAFDDRELNIKWPINKILPFQLEISKKDKKGLSLQEVKNNRFFI